jgi:hypothetical protein
MMETDDEGAPLPSHDEMLQALADGGRVEKCVQEAGPQC